MQILRLLYVQKSMDKYAHCTYIFLSVSLLSSCSPFKCTLLFWGVGKTGFSWLEIMRNVVHYCYQLPTVLDQFQPEKESLWNISSYCRQLIVVWFCN